MASMAVLSVTFVLLIAGVVGALVPFVPGSLLSLLGVLFHWWATGYTTPGLVGLVAFTTLIVAALLVDLFGGPIAASRGGAGTFTIILAVLASLVLALFTGPLGILVGIPLVVFLAEYYRIGQREAATRAALVTTLGLFASNLVQALLMGTVLVGFAMIVLL
jgi:hypothetical protein